MEFNIVRYICLYAVNHVERQTCLLSHDFMRNQRKEKKCNFLFTMHIVNSCERCVARSLASLRSVVAYGCP